MRARCTGRRRRQPSHCVRSDLLYSTGYYAVEPVLIYNTDSFQPASWADLAGSSVAVLDGTALASALGKVRDAIIPKCLWNPLALASTEALIRQVSDGTIDYAIVASNDAEASAQCLSEFRARLCSRRKTGAGLGIPARRRSRCAIRSMPSSPMLKRDGTLQRLIERYFTYAADAAPGRRSLSGTHEVGASSISARCSSARRKPRASNGGLLAAIAYQESQWDTQATSETGVRGLMQLTEDTARQLGVVDRLDPQAGVLAAAKYLRDLKDKLPQRIPEPDRTWLALAAYNIGIAHLEDARVLAQKQKSSPDSWPAVSKALPLLALPEFYEDAKYGYARGGMPVAFVERVRAYYDILLAHQPSLRPRLRMFSASGATHRPRASTNRRSAGNELPRPHAPRASAWAAGISLLELRHELAKHCRGSVGLLLLVAVRRMGPGTRLGISRRADVDRTAPARSAAGKTTIIVPIGGTEQNGPHMVLGKHNVRVKALSEKIARALGNALVAPVIAYVPEGSISPATAHMRFPERSRFPTPRSSRCSNPRRAVSRRTASATSCFSATTAAIRAAKKRWPTGSTANGETRRFARMRCRSTTRRRETSFPQQLRSRGYADAEIGTHAGLADTSLALAVDPRLVRADQLSRPSPTPQRAFTATPAARPRSWDNSASMPSSRRLLPPSTRHGSPLNAQPTTADPSIDRITPTPFQDPRESATPTLSSSRR